MQTDPIKYSDLVKPDSSITDLIKQLEQLLKTYTDAAEKIKAEGQQVAQTLRTTTSATEEGRKTTAQAAQRADELTKAQVRYNMACTDTAKEIARLRYLTQQQNQENKNLAKAASNVAESYNNLSAQYSLNKIKLNAMSAEYRRTTEEGKRLEKETAELYEKMKKLQEATGMHQLNVGNYASALKGLGGVAQQVGGSLGAGGLGKAFAGLSGSMGAMGTAGAAGAAGPIGAAVVGITAIGTAMADGIGTAKDYEKSLSTLAAITGGTKESITALANQARELGATTRYTATEVVELQTELAKLGYTQSDILDMTGAVLNFAQATGASLADASSLTGAALRQFEKDADSAQEFVDKMATSTTKSALSFEYLNTAMSIVSPVANTFGFEIDDVLSLLGALANAGFDASSAATATRNIILNLADANGDLAQSLGEPVKDLDGLLQGLKKLNAEGVGLHETLQLTDKRSVSQFNTFLAGIDTVQDLKDALSECDNACQNMADTMADNLEGDVASLGSAWDDLMIEINDGQGILRDIVKWLTEVVRAIAGWYRSTKEYFTELWNESETLRNNVAVLITIFKIIFDQWKAGFNGGIALAKAFGKVIKGVLTFNWDEFTEGLKDYGKAVADTFSGLISDVVDDVKGMEDLAKVKIKAPEVEKPKPSPKEDEEEDEDEPTPPDPPKLTEEEIKALQKKAEEMRKLAEEQRKRELAAVRKAEDLQTELITDEWEKRRIKTNLNYSRQIEDLQTYLAKNKNISTTERENINAQILSLQQRQAAEIVKIYEEEEKAAQQANKKKYDEQLAAFELQQDVAQSEFDLLETTEKQKTEYRLKAERERWEKILQLSEENGKILSEQEKTIITNSIAKIDEELKQLSKRQVDDVYGLFGLDLSSEKKQAINESFDFAVQQLDNFMASRTAAAEKATKAANDEVQAAQKRLEAEIEARNAGYASEVDTARKELENAKKTQENALKQQQKAQKQQAALQSLQQAGDLVTASAKIWGQLGFPWAVPAIATMWGSFAAAKIKAATMTKEQYRDGVVEELRGGSHQSGNDVDLGVKPDGTRRRAEGGETFAVFTKTATRNHRGLIADVVNAFNNGTFTQRYIDAASITPNVTLTADSNKKELAQLNATANAIREQNERRTITEGGKRIEIYKNTKRIIN